MTGTIEGTVVHNNTLVPGSQLEGWVVYADLNHNGKLDAREPRSVTDSQGTYEISGLKPGPVTIRVEAAKPTRFQRFFGVRRQVWLGPTAATRPDSAEEVPIHQACGRFVDHFTVRSGGPSR
jgi:hypothetical protein